jgi:hypothetical protein
MWSIGIYAGASPYDLSPAESLANPVLTARQVSDLNAEFVADPFMIKIDGRWYMFFEAMDADSRKGVIAVATSPDGLKWLYKRVVLREAFHLSYPYVFEWDNQVYMVPETRGANAVLLYRADNFPDSWSPVASLIPADAADPSPFHNEDGWWIFLCSTPFAHDELRLYYADQLFGPWLEHPMSPIVSGSRRIARPGGRVLVFEDRVVRYTQDCFPVYGTAVRALDVTGLSRSAYFESENRSSPVLGPAGAGWNGRGMHHLDAHLMSDGRWIACVDGHPR